MIGRLLGHSQMETTARYAHLARDSVRELLILAYLTEVLATFDGESGDT